MLARTGAYTRNAALPPRLWSAVAGALAAGAVIALVLADRNPAIAAISQTWPPFALVAGLLLVGCVADGDGLFAAAGSRLARHHGNGELLLAGLLGLVALVTVTLNLDTSVVFLTPLLLEAARSRGLDERAFLYGAVFMSNSASLLLPGSNLTNLLVLADTPIRGREYALRMLAPWLAAVTVTGCAVWAMHRRALQAKGHATVSPPPALRGTLGAGAVAIAVALVLLLRNPALPVLCLGIAVAGQRFQRHRLRAPSLIRALNPLMLLGLFAGAVALGTVARSWGLPGAVMADASTWQSAAVGAVTGVVVNNLPAAVLLSSHPPAHPLFLLLGLDLGPNLAVSGSLSAMLWLQVARRSGAAASPLTYSKLGMAIAPLALLAAAVCLTMLPGLPG